MAKNGLTLKALLQLEVKQFNQGINKVKKQLSGLANAFKSAFALGSIAAFGKQVVNVSKDFEDSMARVKAITNASQKDFENMRKEAAKMGATTRYTASEAAGALENLTRNGMTASQATKALSGVMQLAQANAIDLARSADIVTNVLNMFGLSVAEVGRVNDVLSSTAANAATDIDNLYEALVNASPAAKTLGFSVEETSAAIGALAQRGVKGSDAGTQLRMALTKMADPKIIAKMQAMGVAIDEQSMKSEGLLGTINRLRKAQLSLTDLVGIFSQRGAVGMQQLINSYEDFNRLLEVTKNSAGTTARMFEEGVGTTRKEIDTLKSMYEGLLISIGDKTSGVVNSSVKGLQNLINNFKSVGGTLLNIASVVVPLLLRKVMVLGRTAGTTLGAIKLGLSGIKAAMGGWVTILATVVTWVGTALYGAWAKVNQPLKDAKKHMEEVETNTNKLKTETQNLINKLGPDTDKSSLAGIVKQLTELFPDFADEIKNAAREAGETGNYDALKSTLQDILELQTLIDRREAAQDNYNANVQALGNELYLYGRNGASPGRKWFAANGRDGAMASLVEGGNIARDISIEIYRALRRGDNKYTHDQTKDVFVQIAKVITSSENKVDDLITTLKGWGYEMTREQAENYIKYAPNLYTGWLGKKDYAGKSENWAGEVKKLDSLIVDQKDTVAVKNFRNEMQDLDRQFADTLLTVDDYSRKAVALVDELAGKIGEDSQTVKNLRKVYTLPKTNPGGSGGSGGGGSTAKTQSDQLKDVLTGYTKSADQLKKQLDLGVITQDEYADSINDLVENTYKAIIAFDNFRTLLGKMPQDMQDTAQSVVKSFYTNLEEKAQEEAKKQFKEQLLGLNEFYATKGKSSGYNDYMQDQRVPEGQSFSPAQRNAMRAELDVTLDYSDALKQLIDDLQKGIDNGDFDLVKDDALAILKQMQGDFDKAKNSASSLQHILNFAEAQEQLAALSEQLTAATVNSAMELARGFGSIHEALFNVMELFDEDIKDSPLYEGINSFMTVMDSLITIFQTYQSVAEAFNTITKLQGDIAAVSAAKQAAADAAVTAAEEAKAGAMAKAAAAGAAASTAAIPGIGPILAVAGVASVVAAIIAAMSKFATGGVISGNPTGDKHFVRVNGGEAILTKAQQSSLYNLIEKGGVNGGQVTFKLRGTDLIGSIENTKARMRG